MKICYFGIHKETFARSRVIAMALESQGIAVISCTDHTPSLKKYFNLFRKHWAVRRDYDVMLVGFPGYFTVFLARLLTRKPIIFDAYISYYDGVSDRRDYPAWHPRLLYARLVDFFAVSCADVTLVLNEETRKFFINGLHVSACKMEVLHKGADERVFHPHDSAHFREKEIYRVAWWGTFIPLHGLRYIIEAAALLKKEKHIEFHIIGAGQLTNEIEQQVRKLDLSNVILLGRVSQEKLIEEISRADIALGLFNASPKALRCVTNKVYEAMAMGKPIITEDSPANQEIFTDKKNVYLVPPANPQALSEAIRTLTAETALRQTIAEGALKLFQERFVSRMIGLEFVDIMKRHGLL